MKFNPAPFKIEPYYHTNNGERHQYVVLDADGYDLTGDYMPYKEAVATVRYHKLILRATNNKGLLKVVSKLLNVADVFNSIDDLSDCQEWITNLFFSVSPEDIREILRKPSKLHGYLAKSKAEEEIRKVAHDKYVFIYNNIDKEYMKLYVANRLEIEFLSAENVNKIVADVLEANDLENLRIIAEDKMFLHECCDLVVSEFEHTHRVK